MDGISGTEHTSIVAGVFTVLDASFRASISEHTPLLFDDLTNEPYLPLPVPFQNFRLTPNRESDVAEITEIMNDPKIVYWMDNHPFPFPSELAVEWMQKDLDLTQKIFSAFAEGIWRPAKGSPVKVIREILSSDSGTAQKDVYVGDVDLRHGHWWSERITPIKEHWEEWRDRERIWSIGVALKTSYHNRGIGFIAMSTLFNQWGIPQIGCTEVRAETYVSNIPSNRIWEKLGFVQSGLPFGTVIIQKEKIGGEENKEEKSRVLTWTLP